MADQAALHIQCRQQRRYRGDFIAFIGHFFLSQRQAQLGGEGADHVNRAVRAASGAAQAFAIDSDLLERAEQSLRPAAEGILELLGIEQAEHAIHGVVRGNAILQWQEAPQPGLFNLSPLDRLHKTLCAREDGAYGNDQNLVQGMGDVAPGSRFWHFGQMFHQRPHPAPAKPESSPQVRAGWQALQLMTRRCDCPGCTL
jgi:hypothetical protein